MKRHKSFGVDFEEFHLGQGMLMDKTPGHGFGQGCFQGGQLPVDGGGLHPRFQSLDSPAFDQQGCDLIQRFLAEGREEVSANAVNLLITAPIVGELPEGIFIVDEKGEGRGSGLVFGNDGTVQPVLGNDISCHRSGLISGHNTGAADGLALAPGILDDVSFGAGGLDAEDEALEQGVTNFEDSGSRLGGINEAG